MPPLKVNVAVQSPLLKPAFFPIVQYIAQKHAESVVSEWFGLALTVSVKVGPSIDPGAWGNFIVGDAHQFAGQILGEHIAADKNGQVTGFISAHRTLTRAGAPFGSIVHGRKPSNYSLGTPDTLVPGSFMETLTHEIAESIVDPNINKWMPRPSKNQLWLAEICDQAHNFRYLIPYVDQSTGTIYQGICADFVLPSYYLEGHGGPWSFTGKVSGAFALDGNPLDGGSYAKIIDATTRKTIPGSAADLE